MALNTTGQGGIGGPNHEVTYSAQPAVFPLTGLVEGQELIVTDTGDETGVTLETWIYDEMTNTWTKTNVADINTILGPAVVDSSDPTMVEITIPYANEEANNPDVVFTVPIPTPVSVVNSIDFKPTGNPNEFTVEITYTNDLGVTSTIADTTPVTFPENVDYVEYTGNNTVPTGVPPLGVDTRVLDNGDRYDWDGSAWIKQAVITCPGPMTRAALIALRTAGGLDKNCHYVITNPNTQGTLTAEAIILHALDESTLSMQAGIKTTHDTLAWQGVYDIDADDVLEVTDNLENKVISNASIITFPFGVAAVNGNTVMNRSNITYTGGNFANNIVGTDANVTTAGNTNRNHFEAQSNTTVNSGDFLENRVEGDATVVSSTTLDVDNNIFRANSNTTINTGNFDANEVHSDANVLIDGGVAIARNHFYAASNTTIRGGDFRNNTVSNDATVTSSSTGDVDSNHFGNLSNSTFSGASNFDNNSVNTDGNVTMTGGTVVNSKFEQLSNFTMSGGVLRESTVGQDADVILISGDNYENVFGKSTVYRQVGTGTIRYSNIEGTTTWTNGNTNVSNVNANTATVNTTGSSGTLSNSLFQRAYMINLQNIPSLTIQDSTISNYGTVQTNGSTRIYLYRTTVTDGGRVLCSAGSRIDASYTNVNSYGYIQSTGSGGVTYFNYCNVSSYGYLRNTTTNTNRFDRCQVTSQASMRFDGTASGGRIYYCRASGGAAIYQTTGSVNCYIYYCTADALSQIYTQGSTNARIYYNSATGYSYIRSLNCPGTHYVYYCTAGGRGYVQISASQGRIYSCHVTSQSILEKRGGGTGNIYYSSFNSYYYAYITRASGTSSGLFGQGRRSHTITSPTNIAPYNSGASRQNF